MRGSAGIIVARHRGTEHGSAAGFGPRLGVAVRHDRRSAESVHAALLAPRRDRVTSRREGTPAPQTAEEWQDTTGREALVSEAEIRFDADRYDGPPLKAMWRCSRGLRWRSSSESAILRQRACWARCGAALRLAVSSWHWRPSDRSLRGQRVRRAVGRMCTASVRI